MILVVCINAVLNWSQSKPPECIFHLREPSFGSCKAVIGESVSWECADWLCLDTPKPIEYIGHVVPTEHNGTYYSVNKHRIALLTVLVITQSGKLANYFSGRAPVHKKHKQTNKPSWWNFPSMEVHKCEPLPQLNFCLLKAEKRLTRET